MLARFFMGGITPVGLLTALAGPAMAAAQGTPELEADESVRVVGTVLDRRSSEPIPLAAVDLAAFDSAGEPVWSGLADGRGRFVTGPVPPGPYQMEVVGLPFTPVSHLLVLSEPGVVDVRVEMVRVEYELNPVVVSARRQNLLERAGFYERRRASTGNSLNRAEIEGRDPNRISDLLRDMPGVQVRVGGLGRGADILLRGGCRPLFVLDGIILTGTGSLDDIISVVDVEGMEVYHQASVPIGYRALTTCGVIMLWTRDPGAPTEHEFTWAQLVWAGIAVLTMLGTK